MPRRSDSGATVTLVDKETNRTATTVTNENGAYVFNGLAPRPYTLEVELTGFKKAVLDDVRILPEQANPSTWSSRSAGRPKRSTSPPLRL